MKEKELNRVITKNLADSGWGYKIADPAGVAAKMSTQNPFDGVGFTEKFGICFESKLIKNAFRAFSFNAIRPHQITHLLKIREVTYNYETPIICCITLGVWFPRKYIELFVFDIVLINDLIKKGEKSILGKELENRSNLGESIKIKGGIFDANLIREKVIYE